MRPASSICCSKLFLGCIILIVRIDELGGNALLDKGHIVIYKLHDFVVVLRLFVAYTPALNNFELGEGYFYGFDAFTVNGSRKNKRIGFFIVFVRADAMVLSFTLSNTRTAICPSVNIRPKNLALALW